MTRPSALHRLFGVRPGFAPALMYSGGCDAGGLFDLPPALCLIGAVISAGRFPRAGPAAGVAGAIFFGILSSRFVDVERHARARRRRGECIACGVKLTGAACPACPPR